MMHKQLLGVLLLALLLTILGCANPKPHYIIGVSQCSADIWREKQNAELRMGPMIATSARWSRLTAS